MFNPDTIALRRGINAFTLDLYAILQEKPGNLFFSPYNIFVAMAMVYGGARGPTAKQIAAALKFQHRENRLHEAVASLEEDLQALQSTGVQLITANSLWPQKGYPILDDFLTLLKEHYDSEIAAVDFQNDPGEAIQRINSWVKKKTHGMIPSPIGGLPPELYFLVVTAIYFKGNWNHPFDKECTKQAPFHLTDNSSVMVSMMSQSKRMAYGENDEMQILKLSYTGNNLSMLILLPKKMDRLARLEATLTEKNLQRWLSYCQRRQVSVELPRFKTRSRNTLNHALMSMGLVDAFDQDKADFSGIDGKKQWLFIGNILHEAVIEVTEEGTEAAAATAIRLRGWLPPELPPVVFRADHPFLYVISDQHKGCILFIGRMVDPSK